jgi:hypothetical protein
MFPLLSRIPAGITYLGREEDRNGITPELMVVEVKRNDDERYRRGD